MAEKWEKQVHRHRTDNFCLCTSTPQWLRVTVSVSRQVHRAVQKSKCVRTINDLRLSVCLSLSPSGIGILTDVCQCLPGVGNKLLERGYGDV